MKTMRYVVAVAAALWAGCGGEGSPPPASQFVGTWQATSVTYASNTGLGTREIVAAGGSATLVLGEGTFQFTLTQPGGSSGTLAGTYEVPSVDLMRIIHDGGIEFAWAYSLAGNVLTLSCGAAAGTGSDQCAMVLGPGGGIGFDFNADGALESARFTMTFHR